LLVVSLVRDVVVIFYILFLFTKALPKAAFDDAIDLCMYFYRNAGEPLPAELDLPSTAVAAGLGGVGGPVAMNTSTN